MKNKHLIHLKSSSLVVAAVASLLLTGAHARTWTSSDGSKTFEGELQSYDALSGKVTVTLPNGKRLSFNQDRLSEADITFASGKSIIGTHSLEELCSKLKRPRQQV